MASPSITPLILLSALILSIGITPSFATFFPSLVGGRGGQGVVGAQGGLGGGGGGQGVVGAQVGLGGGGGGQGVGGAQGGLGGGGGGGGQEVGGAQGGGEGGQGVVGAQGELGGGGGGGGQGVGGAQGAGGAGGGGVVGAQGELGGGGGVGGRQGGGGQGVGGAQGGGGGGQGVVGTQGELGGGGGQGVGGAQGGGQGIGGAQGGGGGGGRGGQGVVGAQGELGGGGQGVGGAQEGLGGGGGRGVGGAQGGLGGGGGGGGRGVGGALGGLGGGGQGVGGAQGGLGGGGGGGGGRGVGGALGGLGGSGVLGTALGGAFSAFVPSANFVTTLQNTMREIQKIIPVVQKFQGTIGDNFRVSAAVKDCLDLFDLSHDELAWSVETCNTSMSENKQCVNRQFNVQSWLSAALSNQGTCKESLASSGSALGSMISVGMGTVNTLVSKCLSQVAAGSGTTAGISSRKLVEGYPQWVKSKDRKLLQAGPPGNAADVVVAQDGSGKFKSIQAAINAAPEMARKKYVIRVKKGVYREYVEVPKTKWNLMLVGDGMGVTIITGNHNVVDGFTTYRSATVAVNGRGFMARDLTIENTAGSAKHQAVALRSDSDLSVFYKCSFEGYQDTLYAHALRQFYRECKITGTVDFIFGDAAAVFQDCQILARQALPNQQNIYIAQGRKDPNQNTGFSFQFCNIGAEPDLAKSPNPTPTFLARPWKEYSRTVIMQSFIDRFVKPEGYLPWDGNFGLKTLYYAEFNNTGPGAGLRGRVKWPGFHAVTRANQVQNFTVGHFINGNIWLPSTGVTYVPGMRT
ncbi:Pectinesterase [Rhynchospora pubera]|uniref:Pectinesterase n=1 Tax=Rhynchospora pubera TaxID=906938 RepID=A0AAV8GDB6_9POAL|nr:Pectinesterase [Rhynchospora pubera]